MSKLDLSLNKSYEKIIVKIISKHIPNAKIILFGSRARKDNTEGSDIDIAIDNHSKTTSSTINLILSDLEKSALPIYFDIIDIQAASEHMKKQILKDGIIWKNFT